MKSIYATLTSYNQYMEETRDTVLQCPELSTYGMDQGEGEAYSSEDDLSLTPSTAIAWDADLEGRYLSPPVRTPASATASGTVDGNGLTLLLKVRRLESVFRVSLHALEDEEIGPERLVLYETVPSDAAVAPRTGTLLARRYPFAAFRGGMSKRVFARMLNDEAWGIVVYTTGHPDGEISGFLQETVYA